MRKLSFFFLLLLCLGVWAQPYTNKNKQKKQTSQPAVMQKAPSRDLRDYLKDPAPVEGQEVQKPKPYVPIARWAPGNLQRHWEKHHAEFPEFKTEQEYGDYALRFFQFPPKGTLFKRNEAQDFLFYHPPTNTFGVTTSRGIPKTMFRPDRKMEYWNRQ